MDQDKALEIIVRPKGPSNPQAFAENLLPRLVELDRISASVSPEGLIVAGVWGPDIESALDIIRRHSERELTVSPPHIRYINDPHPMEPLLRVKIEIPREYLGDVLGDFMQRHGIVEDTGTGASKTWMTGHIPLAQTLGYVAHLQRISNGTGSVMADFWKYFPRMPEPPKPRKAGAMRA